MQDGRIEIFQIGWRLHMLHKISDFCDKIDSIKKMSDMLREMKYGINKSPNEAIDNIIAAIQYDCLMVSKDKNKYIKKEDNA